MSHGQLWIESCGRQRLERSQWSGDSRGELHKWPRRNGGHGGVQQKDPHGASEKTDRT